MCRLEDRRRSQSLVHRIWWGISAAGFAVFAGVAIHSNLREGLALVALALAIVLFAVFYDRMLRRR